MCRAIGVTFLGVGLLLVMFADVPGVHGTGGVGGLLGSLFLMVFGAIWIRSSFCGIYIWPGLRIRVVNLFKATTIEWSEVAWATVVPDDPPRHRVAIRRSDGSHVIAWILIGHSSKFLGGTDGIEKIAADIVALIVGTGGTAAHTSPGWLPRRWR